MKQIVCDGVFNKSRIFTELVFKKILDKKVFKWDALRSLQTGRGRGEYTVRSHVWSSGGGGGGLYGEE